MRSHHWPQRHGATTLVFNFSGLDLGPAVSRTCAHSSVLDPPSAITDQQYILWNREGRPAYGCSFSQSWYKLFMTWADPSTTFVLEGYALSNKCHGRISPCHNELVPHWLNEEPKPTSHHHDSFEGIVRQWWLGGYCKRAHRGTCMTLIQPMATAHHGVVGIVGSPWLFYLQDFRITRRCIKYPNWYVDDNSAPGLPNDNKWTSIVCIH